MVLSKFSLKNNNLKAVTYLFQLFYCLLDTVIEELFPELGNSDQVKDAYWENDEEVCIACCCC